ncbi:hypothetical protein [Amycolatopsis xylanica]|uniref:hypothetical protein n=1 Tax=Amycolatopsis xylanica TaxID=589385 RepID=UPI000A595213|nr:hypothetical protein [Amycolatopsis xylanica]
MSITLGRPVGIEDRPRSGGRRAVWLAAGVVVFCVVLVGRVGRFGFNPTDQGFVLAQSWRLLHGELPHADFTSPRPLGSAVLHLVDFAVPAPLFVSSSFVMMVELTVATIAMAALLTRTGPAAWGPSRLGLVAAAAMVNLHTYPLMAWHTVDGVFLVATGLWAVDSGKRRTGFFLLGFAVIVKQSFAPALVLGLLLVVLHPARRQWQRIGVDLLFLVAAPLSYYVLIGGGFPAAKEQLTAATGTWGERLLEIADTTAIVQAGVVLAVLAVVWLARERLGTPGQWLRIALGVAVAAITVSVVVRGQLAHAGDWSITLLWIFMAAAAADAVIQRRFPWQYLSVAGLAWMSSLSWGYPYPGLVAGSMALGTLEVLARTIDLRARWAEALGGGAGPDRGRAGRAAAGQRPRRRAVRGPPAGQAHPRPRRHRAVAALGPHQPERARLPRPAARLRRPVPGSQGRDHAGQRVRLSGAGPAQPVPDGLGAAAGGRRRHRAAHARHHRRAQPRRRLPGAVPDRHRTGAGRG